jgi:hypothetical protein
MLRSSPRLTIDRTFSHHRVQPSALSSSKSGTMTSEAPPGDPIAPEEVAEKAEEVCLFEAGDRNF